MGACLHSHAEFPHHNPQATTVQPDLPSQFNSAPVDEIVLGEFVPLQSLRLSFRCIAAQAARQSLWQQPEG